MQKQEESINILFALKTDVVRKASALFFIFLNKYGFIETLITWRFYYQRKHKLLERHSELLGEANHN